MIRESRSSRALGCGGKIELTESDGLDLGHKNAVECEL